MMLTPQCFLALLSCLVKGKRNFSSSLEAKSTAREFSDQLVFLCIDHICQNFLDTAESLAPELGASEDVFHFLAAQAELLLYLMISALTGVEEYRERYMPEFP